MKHGMVAEMDLNASESETRTWKLKISFQIKHLSRNLLRFIPDFGSYSDNHLKSHLLGPVKSLIELRRFLSIPILTVEKLCTILQSFQPLIFWNKLESYARCTLWLVVAADTPTCKGQTAWVSGFADLTSETPSSCNPQLYHNTHDRLLVAALR